MWDDFRRYIADKDTGKVASVNSEGRQDVVQHAHPNNGYIHFDSGTINSAVETHKDFILIDLSDTANYPHNATDYIHLERIRVHTDPSANAVYCVNIGFLENVDDTNGDFHAITDACANNVTGRAIDIVQEMYPNGPRCTTDFVLSSDKSLNSTAFQTDVNLASTLDPSTEDTPSGNGDLVIRIDCTAGSVDISVELSYHAH